jgi:hypothetical protein
VRCAAAVLVATALAGCGGGQSEEDRVRQALQDSVKSIRARDAAVFCGKNFPSAYLPPRLADRIGVPPGQPGTPAAWDRQRRECVAARRKDGFGEGAGEIPRIKIADVRLGETGSGADGLSRTAKVTTTFTYRGKRMRHVFPMVKYRGDWKVVTESN